MNKLHLYLLRQSQETGFTLIELLVVIIIIGILSAIAIPSFLNQAQKAKQTEAQLNIAAINSSQQAYYTEHTRFADKIDDLGIGIRTDTENYSYSIDNASDIHADYTGKPKHDNLRAYTGCATTTLLPSNEATTRTVLIPSDLNPSGKSTPSTCDDFFADPNNYTVPQ